MPKPGRFQQYFRLYGYQAAQADGPPPLALIIAGAAKVHINLAASQMQGYRYVSDYATVVE